MINAVRAIKGSAWSIDRDYDSSDFVSGLRMFEDRGWRLHLEAANLSDDIRAEYEALRITPPLYVSPCLDVIDHTATHHKFDFLLEAPILNLLEDFSNRLYHADFAYCMLVHHTHVLIEAAFFVDSPVLVSSRIPEREVEKFAGILKRSHEAIAL